MLKSLKSKGHWLFENGYPSLFWAGLTVGLNLLLFKDYFESASCDKKESYQKDAAKILFLSIFLIRLVVFPSVRSLLYRKLGNRMPSRQTLARFEVELNDSIETALFVFETLERLNSEQFTWISYIISIPAIWPIFCSIYKLFNPHFERGPMQTYATLDTSFKRNVFIAGEGLYNLLSLGSAASFIIELLFNLMYNTTHPNPFPQEKEIVLTGICILSIVGAFSVRGRRSYKLMNYLEASSNSLYYFLNFSMSSMSCLDPKSFTDDGFRQTGWIYLLGFGCAALIVSGIGGLHGTENSYKEEKPAYSYSMFPILRLSKNQHTPPIRGLSLRRLP